MTYATRIARLRLSAENCSGLLSVVTWCRFMLCLVPCDGTLYTDMVMCYDTYYIMIVPVLWYRLYCYGYISWYMWICYVYTLWCILFIMCLVSLAGLRLTGTLLFVPQVRNKHGCHPVMSTEGEGTMCTCLVKVGSWSQRFCEPSLISYILSFRRLLLFVNETSFWHAFINKLIQRFQ